MCKLKTVLQINIALFSLIALIHLLRILFQWEVRFGSWAVPYWLNGVFILLAAVMLWLNGKHLRK